MLEKPFAPSAVLQHINIAIFRAKNRFYRANRDLGRILKTAFILQYLLEPSAGRSHSLGGRNLPAIQNPLRDYLGSVFAKIGSAPRRAV